MAKKDALIAGLTFDDVRDLTAAGLPLDQIQSFAEAGFSAEQLMELASSTPKTSSGFSREDIQEIIKAGQDGKYRQNVQHPAISAFSYPEGEVKRKKAELRPTWVNGHPEDAEMLTPGEIDAYNSITRSCTAREGQWSATVKRNGSKEELHIALPVSMDAKPNEPIAIICRELKDGPAAVDAVALTERLAAAEAQIATLTGARA